MTVRLSDIPDESVGATEKLSRTADGEPPGAVWVEVTGSSNSRRLMRPGDRLVLGTHPIADLLVCDPAVSRRHCRLEHRGRHLAVVDLGSKNGIHVGGARVERALLPTDGLFHIGRSVVCLRPALQRAAAFQPLPGMVGQSPPMRRLATLVRRCAPLRLSVLLLGESGTGKELVARAIHASSSLAAGPFVAINGATFSVELSGSELFGHCRGAFTGAAQDRSGAFRRADGGTLFIDEVAALPLDVQAKMLRVVEDGAVVPVGGDEPTPVSVRVITATCESLDEMVGRGDFRADLYQRLAACLIHVPTLRERRSDIAALANHLLATSELGPRVLSSGACEELRAYSWPGNVRELRNVLVQTALVADGRVLERAHVAAVLGQRRAAKRPRLRTEQARRLLDEADGNISEAARRAGLPRTTFRDRLRAKAQ